MIRRFGPTFLALSLLASGCAHHRITAVPLSPQNQCERDGIPYYLPKPLLIIAKNVRHIDESKVGLTNPVPIPNGWDNQATYADVKANVTVPGSGSAALQAASGSSGGGSTSFDPSKPELPSIAPIMVPSGRVEDGIAPDSFFTYQIVFVPDLTQKYGLRIKGGAGEMRAAMNLVNGWMYTGMGPYYLKDSSTAQNLMAFGVGSMFAGRGVADVLGEVNELAKTTARPAGGGAPERGEEGLAAMRRLAAVAARQQRVAEKMVDYAEIYIYEPVVTDGTTHWELITHQKFDRQYFTTELNPETMKILLERATPAPTQPAPAPITPPPPGPSAPGTVERGEEEASTPASGSDRSTLEKALNAKLANFAPGSSEGTEGIRTRVKATKRNEGNCLACGRVELSRLFEFARPTPKSSQSKSSVTVGREESPVAAATETTSSTTAEETTSSSTSGNLGRTVSN